MKSIMVEDMEHCIFCFKMNPEEHHVFFGTANRPKSEKYGLKIPACDWCHREGPNAPHKNKAVDIALKCWAQSIFESTFGDRNTFRREFGKSYL